jgi:hypothetical protein
MHMEKQDDVGHLTPDDPEELEEEIDVDVGSPLRSDSDLGVGSSENSGNFSADSSDNDH